MTNIDYLVKADLQTHWIAVEAGALTVIEKDWRIVRLCKSIASFFTGVDYYQHINRDRVLQAIVRDASGEADSNIVEQYIEVAERINRGYPARSRILEAHPEMLARFDAASEAYAVPAVEEPHVELTPETARALNTMKDLVTTVYRTTSVMMRNDARSELVRRQFQAQSNYPMDKSGNYWIAARVQHKFRIKISQRHLQAVGGPWWRIKLPEQPITLDNSKHPPFLMKERVLYLLQEGELRKNAQNIFQVVIEDRSAAIKPDGTAEFANGRVCDLKLFSPKCINGIAAGSTITYNTIFEPFPLTNHEKGIVEPVASWDI